MAECCERQTNQSSFVLLYFRLFTFSGLYWVCLSVFSCTVLFVSVSQVIGCEDRLRSDLYCVEWGVKPYSTYSNLVISEDEDFKWSWRQRIPRWVGRRLERVRRAQWQSRGRAPEPALASDAETPVLHHARIQRQRHQLSRNNTYCLWQNHFGWLRSTRFCISRRKLFIPPFEKCSLTIWKKRQWVTKCLSSKVKIVSWQIPQR